MALSLILGREIQNSFVRHLAQRLALIMMLMDIHNESPVGRNKAPGHTASQAEHLTKLSFSHYFEDYVTYHCLIQCVA